MRRTITFGGIAAAALATTMLAATPAGACGFLVARNGAIELQRTTTLATWENGVEHYVTSFEFESAEASFGSLIPLPGNPTTVEKAGEWTLQRLRREVAPQEQATPAATAAVAASAADVTVLREVQIDSLDVTVLKGGGAAVTEWARTNGFDVPADVGAVLEHYGNLSPYFLAAKFDAARAATQQLRSGQGTPIHLEIPLDRPWVPLQILAAGKQPDERVGADVFLLTPGPPKLGRLDPGVSVERSTAASQLLLDDLRSDTNSAWIPERAVLTHVTIDARAADVRRDLVPLVAPVPVAPANPEIAEIPAAPVLPAARAADPVWPIALGAATLGLLAGAAAMAAARGVRRPRRRPAVVELREEPVTTRR